MTHAVAHGGGGGGGYIWKNLYVKTKKGGGGGAYSDNTMLAGSVFRRYQVACTRDVHDRNL